MRKKKVREEKKEEDLRRMMRGTEVKGEGDKECRLG